MRRASWQGRNATRNYLATGMRTVLSLVTTIMSSLGVFTRIRISQCVSYILSMHRTSVIFECRCVRAGIECVPWGPEAIHTRKRATVTLTVAEGGNGSGEASVLEVGAEPWLSTSGVSRDPPSTALNNEWVSASTSSPGGGGDELTGLMYDMDMDFLNFYMPQGNDSLPASPPREAVERGQGGGMGTWSGGGGMVRRPLVPPEAGGYMGPRGGGTPIYPLDATSGYDGEKRPRVGQQAEEAQGGPGHDFATAAECGSPTQHLQLLCPSPDSRPRGRLLDDQLRIT